MTPAKKLYLQIGVGCFLLWAAYSVGLALAHGNGVLDGIAAGATVPLAIGVTGAKVVAIRCALRARARNTNNALPSARIVRRSEARS